MKDKYRRECLRSYIPMPEVPPPETLSASPISTASSDISASVSSRRSRNPVKYAAKSVAGVFIACFTPPEAEDESCSPKQGVGGYGSHRLNSPSVLSENKRRGIVRSYKYNSTTVEIILPGIGNVKLSMADIYKATHNFSPSLKIGQGGFGTVYRATLKDGTLVAVKRAKRIDHGKQMGAEFRSETQILAQVDHLNLVKFYGFVEEEDERILLVEYVPNGTLREHLDCIRGDVLDMAARLDIAIDVAHAITYLHMYTDNPIIHRDIKSSNILLTERCRAKVADFGFARLAADRDSGLTHVSTQVKGTAGYLDPEYLKTYQLTEKSDVYSFGVLLVELVTGRRPIETKRIRKERFTPIWAIMKFTEGDAISTMDPKLEATAANVTTLEKILELAFICLDPQRQNRPTMKRCAEILWSIRKYYRELSASNTTSFSPDSQMSSSIKQQ